MTARPPQARWRFSRNEVSAKLGTVQQHDLEQVRALLGHKRIDTTQIYATIRPAQLKRAVALYEDKASRLLSG